MTVAELIEKLKTLPPEAPVATYFDGYEVASEVKLSTQEDVYDPVSKQWLPTGVTVACIN